MKSRIRIRKNHCGSIAPFITGEEKNLRKVGFSSQCFSELPRPFHATLATTTVLAIENKIKVIQFFFKEIQRKLGWVRSKIFEKRKNYCYFFLQSNLSPKIIWKSKDTYTFPS
jgi:hypothetical protein